MIQRSPSVWLWPPLAALLTVGCVPTPARVPDGAAVTAVRSILETQQVAWNRGDIEGFMAGYAREDNTTFVSGDTITRGWRTVLENYQRRYPTRDQMGVLEFSELDIRPLAADLAVVDGRWRLQRSNDAPSGRFTLLFRHTPEGWRIIHDTTTVAAP